MRRPSRPLPPEVINDINEHGGEEGNPILKHEAAQNALATLFWLGCDPKPLFQLIYTYCTADEEDNDRKQKPDEFDKRVRKLSRRLAKDAATLREIGSLMIPPVSPEISRKMESVVRRLNEAYKSWIQPDMPRGARVGFLAEAVEMVRMETSKPHYQELADIVSFFHGSTTPANLRIKVRNYKDRGEMKFHDLDDVRTYIYLGHKKWDALRRKLQNVPAPRAAALRN
jgi:hypothetical protein